MNCLVSSLVPPRTNNPSCSPICCVPGRVRRALAMSPPLPAVVTTSRGVRDAPLALSLAIKLPADITTGSMVFSSCCRIRSILVRLSLMTTCFSMVRNPTEETTRTCEPFASVVKRYQPDESVVVPLREPLRDTQTPGRGPCLLRTEPATATWPEACKPAASRKSRQLVYDRNCVNIYLRIKACGHDLYKE
jgi:hypothetical protein